MNLRGKLATQIIESVQILEAKLMIFEFIQNKNVTCNQ